MRIYWFLIWRNLNPLHPRKLCAELGWNWPSGSGVEDFWISSMYFCYFVIISPWKKGGALYLNKLESPSPKDALCKFVWNWLSGSGEEDYLISSMYFRYFVIFSPWKRAGPSSEQTWIPSTKGCLCQVWLKLAQWFWRRRWKCEKFTDGRTDGQTDGQTDGKTDRQRTTGDQKCSLELSAQVS